MSSLRNEVVAEFKRLEEDLLYTEKAHFAAAEHFKMLHYLLGGVAAVASAATAASVLDERSKLATVLSLVAAVAAALITFVKPEATATRHVEAARQLGDLRFRIRQARLLDAHEESSVSTDDMRALARGFTAEKQALLADAPTTSSFAFWRGKRKIEKGHFDYEAGNGPTGTESGA
jgi:hypothetical protein